MSVFGILLQIYIYSFVIATLAMFIEQGKFRLKTLVPILNTLLSLEFLNSILLKTFKSNKDGDSN